MNFYCYLEILDPMVILIKNTRYCVFVYVLCDIEYELAEDRHMYGRACHSEVQYGVNKRKIVMTI
jgi:hypothetical protein